MSGVTGFHVKNNVAGAFNMRGQSKIPRPFRKTLDKGLLFHYSCSPVIRMKRIKDHHMYEIRNKHTKELVDLEVGKQTTLS